MEIGNSAGGDGTGRYTSTSSTISGIYRSILPSPAPVCMFYFAHPFGGIATPSSSSYSTHGYDDGVLIDEAFNHNSSATKPIGWCDRQHEQQQHVHEYIPWPQRTWVCDDVLLQPLLLALRERFGQNRAILNALQEIWFPTATDSALNLQQLYSILKREKQLNVRDFDFISNWHHFNTGTSGTAAACHQSTNNTMTDAKNQMEMKASYMMGGRSQSKPHTGLLRRRHSLPEIIMRKHTLATQKHTFDNLSATRAPAMATAPTPPARERIPMSFHSSLARTRANSPYSSGSSIVSTIASTFPSSSGGGGGGSDTNLSQVYSANGSMRRQLLQRLWSREFQRFNRTGSVSPPLQRSQRSRRAWRHMEAPSPSVCVECQKLDASHFNRSLPETTSKRAKYSKFASSPYSSLKQKSHSIETETIDSSQGARTESSLAEEQNERISTNESTLTAATNASRDDVDENRNFTTSDVYDSDAPMAPSTATNTFQIEMDGDQINIITTTTSTSSTAASDSTAREHRPAHIESKNSRSNETDENHQIVRSDENSNYVSDIDAAAAITVGAGSGEFVTQATPSSSPITTTTISIDQSTIDSFISQILVDSLNNIIVVEGKVSGPSSNDDCNLSGVMHSVSSQTTDSSMPTADDNYHEVEGNARPTDASGPPQKIYFPKYATDDSLSEYSAKYSNESTAIELPAANIVISVMSGSSYPLDGGEMIVHRYAQMPRTESMEVRPSSGSVIDGDANGDVNDANGNENNNGDGDDDDDDRLSFDSLEDPTENSRDVAEETQKPIEKSKAFFVPMDDDIDHDASAEQETPDITVGYAMPERLRERLQRRQMEMNRRKEYEMKRKQEKIQRIIEQFESQSAATDDSTIPETKMLKKKNNKFLRSEVGLLESYTVDAQGNLLFKEPQKAKASNVKKVPLALKRTTGKKTVKPVAVAPRKPREVVATKVVAVKRVNAVAVKPLSESRHRSNKDSIVGRRTDVQKMTLYHHSPADIVTPDADCGPRRMYQKTEIHDGKKRIEILEIVECANSSPDSLATTATSPTSSTTTGQTKSSKIPVPVAPVKKPSSRTTNGHHQRLSKANTREAPTNHSVSKNFAKNLHQLNKNSKVDQIIADLLIEALNSSTDIGIEFVKTPQQGATNAIANQSSLIKVSNTKRVCLSTAAAAGAVNGRRNSVSGGGKRSAHSSGKYQQVFDAIPEEKSSLSMDSPENNLALNSSPTSDTVSSSIIFAQENSVESKNEAPIAKRTANGQARGKEAIHSDQEKPEAWFGCFGQRHNESPVDPVLLDEEMKRNEAPASAKQPNETVAPGTDSAISAIDESIPSQTGETVETSGSEYILRLLDETFETSVTGVRATTKKPYQRKPKCTSTHHVNKCAECETIENELNVNESSANEKVESKDRTKQSDRNESKRNDCNLAQAVVQPMTTTAANRPSENVWQVGNIEKYDTFSKLNLSPITILSSRDDGLATSDSTINTGIDSTSFIVLRNDEHLTQFFPNITTTGTSTTSGDNLFYSKNSGTADNHRPCYDCCFCNPALHHRRDDSSPKTCNFCSSCHQTRREETPANMRYQQQTNINQLNNGATDRSTTATTERLYESRFRSNHKHVRTQSRETGLVSTNCTKRSNRKIRQITPATDDVTNGNATQSEPQPTEIREKSKTKNNNIRETNETQKANKKSSIPKLPPCEWSSNSCETNTNPSTSSSTSTTSSSPRMRSRQNSKSVPNLPVADRNQNLPKSKNSSTKSRMNSRYQHFYGSGDVNDDDRAVANPTDAKKLNNQQEWTVTLAGTYQDDMAPDVQMHLSFPQRASSHGKVMIKRQLRAAEQITRTASPPATTHSISQNGNADDEYDIGESIRNDLQQAIMPAQPSNQLNFNPRRTLSRNHYNSESHPQQKYGDANGNRNDLRSKNYNLPDVNPQRDNSNRIVAKRTAKKTIKRSEYSVALTSATTRTFSNFANTKRGMSYHGLNASGIHRGPKSENRYLDRDHSVDLGNLLHQLSSPSPQLSSYNCYSPYIVNEDAPLSVLGNAIAPERKPPVPTMSERDLTRRHNACFTRNRSICP